MIVVSGGDLILSGRLVSEGSLIIDGGRIRAIESRRVDPAGATIVDASDCYVAPGFIDVHVHGLHGHDTLDGEGAVSPRCCLDTESRRFARQRWRAVQTIFAACYGRSARRELRRLPDLHACCQPTSKATSSTQSTKERSPRIACAMRVKDRAMASTQRLMSSM